MKILAAIALLWLSGCATLGQSYYSAEPIEGWVVDAESGAPLEGVVVVAHWELIKGTAGGSYTVGQMMVLETVTDQAGRYFFPGWGPLKNPTDGHLDHRDPRILMFKSGYRYRGLENDYAVDYFRKPSKRRSEWSGQTIKVQRFNGKPREYADHLSFLTTDLGFMRYNCSWKRVRQMVLAMKAQEQQLRAQGAYVTLYSPRNLPANEAECGSPEEFFRSY